MHSNELIHTTHLDAAVFVIAATDLDCEDDEFEDAGICPECILAWCGAMGNPTDADSQAANIMTGIVIGVRAARLKDAQS